MCPKSRLTVSIGTPLDSSTVVAAECRATWYVKCAFIPHKSAMAFNFLLQVELLGMGNTLLSRVIPLYFSIIFRGTSSNRILDSVLVFFLRVIIHRLPSKNVCRLSSVRFLTSEHANPVKVENMNRSLTSSWSCRAFRCSSLCVSPLSRYTLCPHFQVNWYIQQRDWTSNDRHFLLWR